MQCDICGRTDQECKIRTIKKINLCPKHLTQYYRHNTFLKETIYEPNEYVYYNNYAEIILKDKNCVEVARCKIDLDDIEKCKKYKWHLRKVHKNQYAIATIKGSKDIKVHLHRLILNYDGEQDVDHINGDGLDNRKSNLRIVSRSLNILNMYGIRGIKKVPSGKYQATIMKDYKCIYLGTFDTYEQAVEVRLNAEKQFFKN